jgi:glycosyltransferase involved in cell wall biosynthesis
MAHETMMRREAGARVLFIGTLPPPVDGQTLATASILDELRRRSPACSVADTAKSAERDWRQRLGRAARLTRALAIIPIARLRGARSVYISALANAGMYHSALCAFIARAFGLKLLIHHEVASYLRSPALRMKVLAACAGPTAIHVVLCEPMGADLKARYRNIHIVMALNNSFAVPDPRLIAKEHGPPLRLGHLSNLSLEKGLKRVIEVLEYLLERGIPATLTVAGPPASALERELIARTSEDLPDRFFYLGRVTGEAKERFFAAIDVFLFPSLYPNEAQPIVCLEAMAAGVPVLAYDWSYLQATLGEGGGQLIDTKEVFAERALPILRDWAEHPSCLAAASRSARDRFVALRRESLARLDELVALLVGGERSR